MVKLFTIQGVLFLTGHHYVFPKRKMNPCGYVLNFAKIPLSFEHHHVLGLRSLKI